jgi:HlyD family secretion protein
LEEKKDDIIYSEPVSEIMGHPPGRILKWGSTIILAVCILILFLAWLVRYPDIVPAQVEITTVNPPVTILSKITGRIKNLYVKDRDTVASGKLLAVMETAASIGEVSQLKQLTDTISKPEKLPVTVLPVFAELGELQPYWGTFLKSLSDYYNYILNDYYGNKINKLTEEIDNILVYIGRVKVKEQLYSENQMLEERKFRRDSMLHVNGVFSESDLEKSRQSLLKQKIDLQQVRLDHSAKSIELAEKRQLLQDYKITGIQEKEKYYSVLNESFMNLKAQIRIWEINYLIISQVAGIVTFTRFWSENQIVNKDEPVISIVPFNAGDYVGRINLKMHRSGKVKTGQEVNIKLSGFPYLQYGMVRGIVNSKSLVPAGDAYVIELSLPSGLTTLYGNKLEFTQNMQGTAEIITEDLRLLQKIFYPLRYLISRNKR